ncbi:MAG: DUF2877 domain-containing protein [Rhodospirillales bacterium]|nr:DUF2877 domain-containing protein [Rhodospirillales bacterium]
MITSTNLISRDAAPLLRPSVLRAVTIEQMGPAAKRVLADGMRGTVLAKFRRCFYVEDSVGGLACIGTESIGAGPLNALISGSGGFVRLTQVPAPGTPVRVDGGILFIGGLLAFDLTEAKDWQPTAVLSSWSAPTLSAGLDFLAVTPRGKSFDDGLGRLIPILTGALDPGSSDLDSPICRLAQTAVKTLEAWLVRAFGRYAFEMSPPAEALGLVGLGPGLTPSGDDFLGGLLIALRALGGDDLADELNALVLPFATEGTGKISAAHLSCAGAGTGAAALHDTINAILAGDIGQMRYRFGEIDDIGHTSGWDALAGTVCALGAWLRAKADSTDMVSFPTPVNRTTKTPLTNIEGACGFWQSTTTTTWRNNKC